MISNEQGECVDKFQVLEQIASTDLPQQIKNLSDNANNLEKVAQYCEDIYVNAKELDKGSLLSETKSFTTQALASLSYQM